MDNWPDTGATVIADGYGIRITVHDNMLNIQDGITEDRCRNYSHVDAPSRLLVAAPNGYISFDAIRWLADSGIPWFHVARSTVIASSGIPAQNPLLIRAQALARDTETGLNITRYLLSQKLFGSSRVARFIGDNKIAAYLESRAEMMLDKATIQACTQQEGISAQKYWQSWREHVAVSFAKGRKIPVHWSRFPGRDSLVSTDNRNASDPINSMLNYAYGMGYGIAVNACHAAGISPVLGVWHSDKEGISAFAYDLLEAIRADCDRIALDVLSKPVNPKWFIETPSGEVRLLPPLTHHIAAHSPELTSALAPHIAEVTRLLNFTTTVKISHSHHGNRLRKGVTVTDIIPEAAWGEIRPLLPERVVRKDSSYSDRELIACLAVKYLLDCPWSATLTGRQNYNSARRKLVEYQRYGIWEQITKILETSGHLASLLPS